MLASRCHGGSGEAAGRRRNGIREAVAQNGRLYSSMNAAEVSMFRHAGGGSLGISEGRFHFKNQRPRRRC